MILNKEKLSSIVLSALVAFYFISVFFISSTSFDIITPASGIVLSLLSIVAFSKSFRLSFAQWFLIIALSFFLIWVWLDFLTRSSDEYLLVFVMTYQYGVVVLVAILGKQLNSKILLGIIISSVLIVFLSMLSTGGILLIRQNSIYQSSVNQLGAVLALGLGISIWLINYHVSKNDSFYTFTFILISLLLFFSIIFIGSRQTFILMLPWLIMLWFLNRKKWLMVGGTILVITFSLIYFFFSEIYIFQRFYTFFLIFTNNSYPVDYSTVHRLELINFASTAWMESPIYGQGIRAFEKLSGFGHYAHNNYLEMLYNFGLIGFVLFYTPIVFALFHSIYYIKRYDKNQKKWLALLIGCSIFILIQGIFIVDYFRYATWCCIALMSLSLKKAN